MGGNWKHMPLGEFVTLQRGHDLPDEYRRPGRIPIYGSFGITGWHDEPKASGPGVTVGRSGASFGVVCYSPEDYWPLNTALYVIDFHGNDPRFAYYFLSQFDFRQYNSGSAQPSLNRNFIHPIPVLVPPLSEQRAIAHILGTLDDKIELNRRMNETLEGMARTLFKSWFVDFDPVRAKAEGRDTGLPKHIANLFPEEFVDSELGEIPKGWRSVTVGEFACINYGKNLPQAEMRGSGIPVYGAAGVVGYYSEAMFEEPIVLVTSRGSNSGSIHETDGPAFITNNSFSVVPIHGSSRRHFLRFSLLQADIHSRVTGSAQPQLTIANFSSLRILLPAWAILEQFDKSADSLWNECRASRIEARILATLRDALLPKLISGELRVRDSERFLEMRA